MNSFSGQLLFVSMSDTAGGAENILCMMAGVTESPMLFLKHTCNSRLKIPHLVPVRYLTSGAMLSGFIKLIKALYPYRKNYMIISTHPYLNAYLGMLKRIGYIQSNLIVRECSTVFGRYKGLKKMSYRLAYWLGYPAVNLIVCQTALMRSQLLAHNKFIPPYKAFIKANPVDLDQILEKAKESVEEQFTGSDFICAAGRLIPEKGFSVLIRAFSNIADQHKNLKLLILGSGRAKESLDNLIMETDLGGRVILTGHIDNPIPYFKTARLCVVSSIIEGFPNVLLEMMAVSPSWVVSTLCAGGIEDLPAIVKVQVNHVDALTAAIQYVLCKDPGKQDVAAYFKYRTPEKYMHSILREYNQLYA